MNQYDRCIFTPYFSLSDENLSTTGSSAISDSTSTNSLGGYSKPQLQLKGVYRSKSIGYSDYVRKRRSRGGANETRKVIKEGTVAERMQKLMSLREVPKTEPNSHSIR